VLPIEGQEVKLEASCQGSIELLGVKMTNTTTYLQTIRPEGVLYGEGRMIALTKEGEVADLWAFGVGRPTGPAPSAHWACCGSFRAAPQALARLTAVATVFEWDVDQNGNYRWKIWEWK
jgi:hypothetical protein